MLVINLMQVATDFPTPLGLLAVFVLFCFCFFPERSASSVASFIDALLAPPILDSSLLSNSDWEALLFHAERMHLVCCHLCGPTKIFFPFPKAFFFLQPTHPASPYRSYWSSLPLLTFLLFYGRLFPIQVYCQHFAPSVCLKIWVHFPSNQCLREPAPHPPPLASCLGLGLTWPKL